MKRIISSLIILALIISGCSVAPEQDDISEMTTTTTSYQDETTTSTTVTTTEISSIQKTTETTEIKDAGYTYTEKSPEYQSLNDPKLLLYLEDEVYRETIKNMNGEDYVIQDVKAFYVSKEYIEESLFNSRENVFFGYTRSQLDDVFPECKYAFTIGEDGNTIVYEVAQDEFVDKYSEMVKDIATGTGVIVICVTACVVAPELGAPMAVQQILAFSAEGAIVGATSTAAISAVSTAVIRGVETHDFSMAVADASKALADGYRIGAISGAVTGAVSEATFLEVYGIRTGMTMSQIAQIQKEAQLPWDIIWNLNSFEEYEILRDAGLVVKNVGGRTALVRDIDWNLIIDEEGHTNLWLAQHGKNPMYINSKGVLERYEVHHVGQNEYGVLAILKNDEHKLIPRPSKGFDHTEWNKYERPRFWKAMALMVG